MARERIGNYNYNHPHKFLGKLSPIEYVMGFMIQNMIFKLYLICPLAGELNKVQINLLIVIMEV